LNHAIHPRAPRLAICGPSDAGKDEAAGAIAAAAGLRFGGSLSVHLARRVGARLGISGGEAYARRRELEPLFKETADAARRDDPEALLRDCLAESDLVVGCRAAGELALVRRAVDLVLWVDRDVPPDWTLEYGPEACDLVVPNRGTLPELHARLERICKFAGLPWDPPAPREEA